jgi:hypothetical protein
MANRPPRGPVFPLLLPLALALLLGACASAPGLRPEDAADRFTQAETALRTGNLAAARSALAELPRRRLEAPEQLRHDLLSAELALAEGRGAEALSLLQQDPRAVPRERRADWLGLRARALEATGDRFGMAAALAERSTHLEGEARARALRDAERQLKAVPDAALSRQAGFLAADDALLPLAQRELRRRGLDVVRPGSAPAPAIPPSPDGYAPPRRIAVLLPTSGELAAAGGAVRDGLLAAYYAERRQRPGLVFLDTRGTAEGARRARAQAMAQGADLILGPLGREEVAALAAAPAEGLGWIALNRTPLGGPGGASFALSPEDEGAAVALRLIERGVRRVLVVAEADDSAQRGLAGFRERFLAEGGSVLAEAALDALGGTAAEALGRLAPRAAEAQALFIAARAPAVRILMPQREAAGLAALPVVATSLVQSGADPRLDRELDGLQYPELPWLLGDLVGPGDAESLARSLPSARGGAARLFAFGFDAWKVATHLEALRGGAVLRGATGELGIDAAGVVERRPAWAEFSGGLTRRASDGALLPIDAAPPGAP